jgi:glycosyltransferase involved in cell wall biosynthesis
MHADAITTTHYKIADVIRSETGNRNIYVIPNGINPEHDQFANKPVQNKNLTFGWSGSITHFEDVMLMHDSLYSLYKSEFNTRFNFVYGGHEKKDTFSNQILGVLSCKGIANESIFATYPATDVFNYANFYDLIDVSLIPLRDNRFNNLKSNLKLLESGFKKKAAIVSDVEPYSAMLTNANSLKVQNKKGWYTQMIKLINNRSMVEDLANQLHEDVQQYHIKVVANKRLEAYNDILS